jgi:hypothetical protein
MNYVTKIFLYLSVCLDFATMDCYGDFYRDTIDTIAMHWLKMIGRGVIFCRFSLGVRPFSVSLVGFLGWSLETSVSQSSRSR